MLAPDALTTPDRVREAQGWDICSYPDARLFPKINSVSARIRRLTGREFGFQRYTVEDPLFVSSAGGCDLWLPTCNIRALASISVQGVSQTVLPYGYAAALQTPDAIFRSRIWDAEGRLLRPAGWPASWLIWGDGTGHTYPVSGGAFAVSLAGDFGFVLPQYDDEVNEQHNPDKAPADLPADLEGIAISAVVEALTSSTGNVRREKTPGGWEVEYTDSVVAQANRDAELLAQLSFFALPGAWFTG